MGVAAVADGGPSVQKILEKLCWANRSLMKFSKNPSTARKITSCFSTSGQLAALGSSEQMLEEASLLRSWRSTGRSYLEAMESWCFRGFQDSAGWSHSWPHDSPVLRGWLQQMVSFEQCFCVCGSVVLPESDTQDRVDGGFFSLPHTVSRSFLGCSRKSEWQQAVVCSAIRLCCILSLWVVCPFCLV